MLACLAFVVPLLWSCIYVTARPNFIFILSDDQDITLDSMQAMPNTLKYIANEGVTFNNTFISTPICCPSRTETITGRNFQNIKAQNETQNDCMKIAATVNVFNNTDSMFQIFTKNGYLTASFGKLTNNMPQFWCKNVTKTNGFSRINCPCNFNNFYNLKYFDKFINGSSKLYNINLDENAYQTSYVGNASIDWLNDRMTDIHSSPFIMWVGIHAPHFPATPAAWYADRYNTSISPEQSNFNTSDSLKHGFVATNPDMDDTAKYWIDQSYRDRLRSLLSLDDLVYDIFNVLSKYPDKMDNTYILYTSDHGFHLGQYDIPCAKMQPYEETIRIPMYLRGPNIPKNQIKYDIVGNIDILPTFLDLAGIKYDVNTYDGRSLLYLFNGSNAVNWRTTYLTQYQSIQTATFSHCTTWFPSINGSVVPGQVLKPPANNSNGEKWFVDNKQTNNFRALRIINTTNDLMYAEFVDNAWNNESFNNPNCFEYYDLKKDPFQLKNAYSSLSTYDKNEFHLMIMKYGACKGSDCW